MGDRRVESIDLLSQLLKFVTRMANLFASGSNEEILKIPFEVEKLTCPIFSLQRKLKYDESPQFGEVLRDMECCTFHKVYRLLELILRQR